MLKIDMWNNESLSNATKFDCFWSDIDCVYRGNIYQGNRIIGDYTASTLQEFERKWEKVIIVSNFRKIDNTEKE
nr:MAG TPA: hypothetical protein [Caudoviricetes sp.]